MGNLTNSQATTIVGEHDYTKGATINGMAQILDDCINGQIDVTITTADVALTGTPAAPQAQHLFVNVSGTLTGNRAITVPVTVAGSIGKNRLYVVKNGTAGAFTLTFKVAGGTGVTIGQGNTAFLLFNGTDIQHAAPQIVSATGVLAPVSVNVSIGARVYHNAAQSLTSGTLAILNFNSERFDTDVMHDNVTNNSRLTCKTAGLYSIVGNIGFAASATGNRVVFIKLNGTTYIADDSRVGTASQFTVCCVNTLYQLAVNDYVEIEALQTSGGALSTLQAGNYSPEFSAVRLGA